MSKPKDIPPDPACQAQTILVVDDEGMVRELICYILRRRGYTVLEANRGVEALRICQEHAGPIHLLLTDILMPEMNGPALAEQVRVLRPSTRVLYMSGYTGGTFAPHFDSNTEMAFLQKPFSPDALAHKVGEILDPAC